MTTLPNNVDINREPEATDSREGRFSFGVYKFGQGYWVRMITSLMLGILSLAGAGWAWNQLQAISPPTPTWQIKYESVEGAAPAIGQRIELVNTNTQPAVTIGDAAIVSVDAPNNTLVIGDIKITGGNRETPADGQRLQSLPAAPEGSRFRIDYRGINALGIASFQIIYLQAAVAAVFLIIGAIAIYWYVGRNPRSVDFLIATDGEMRKVNWSSRKVILNSTYVVIGAAFLVAAAIFIIDNLLSRFFMWIKIL